MLDQDGGSRGNANTLAARVRDGNSAVAVHPRTDYEIESARDILRRHAPLAVEEILH